MGVATFRVLFACFLNKDHRHAGETHIHTFTQPQTQHAQVYWPALPRCLLFGGGASKVRKGSGVHEPSLRQRGCPPAHAANPGVGTSTPFWTPSPPPKCIADHTLWGNSAYIFVSSFGFLKGKAPTLCFWHTAHGVLLMVGTATLITEVVYSLS